VSQVADVLRLARDLVGLARRMGGVLPVDISDLPVKALAAGIADRGDQLGLVWRLVPGTIGTPGTGGEMRVTLDGDSTSIAATSMIGRLPVGARVFVILSPPAGVHIVGFMGYDFPPSVAGEAIGRSRQIVLGTNFTISTDVMQNVTGMTFTALAGAAYEIRLRAAPAAAIVDDYKIDWTIPSGQMDRNMLYPSISYQGNDARLVTPLSMLRLQTGAAIGGGIAGNEVAHWEDIYFKCGATGGPVQLRFARNAAAGSSVTLRLNSYMIVQRYR
jgi:hypothetical protein